MRGRKISLFLLFLGTLMMLGNGMDVFLRAYIAPPTTRLMAAGFKNLFTDNPIIVSVIYFDNFLLAMRIVIGFGLFFHAGWAYRLFYRYALLLIAEMVLIAFWLRFYLQENPPFFPVVATLFVLFFVRSDWVRGRFPHEH